MLVSPSTHAHRALFYWKLLNLKLNGITAIPILATVEAPLSQPPKPRQIQCPASPISPPSSATGFHSFYTICWRHYSSTGTKKNCSFTVSYLISKFGISPEKALTASKYLHFDTSDKPDSVLALFRSYGFSDSEIANIIRRYPLLLGYDPFICIAPKLNFFKSIGASSSEIVSMTNFSSHFLTRSLENFIIPAYDFANDFLQSDDKKSLRVLKFLFIIISHPCVRENVQLLLDHGIPKSNIALMFGRRYLVCRTGASAFNRAVAQVKEIGFHTSKSAFVLALVALLATGKPKWKRKVEIFRKFGWSHEAFLSAFKKQPMLMFSSETKITAIMDFCVNHLGCDAMMLARNPGVLCYSFEKTIRPRYTVLMSLMSKGLINQNAGLNTALGIAEEVFLQKFVYRFKDHSPQLLKLYQEQSNLSKKLHQSMSNELLDSEILSANHASSGNLA